MINEFMEKDNLLKPKLTIAIDRISLKVPASFSPAEQTRIIQLKDNIVEHVGPVETTLRGKFGMKDDQYYIYLHVQSGSKKNKQKITKYKIFEGDF